MGERGPLAQPTTLRLITGINKKSSPAALTSALRPVSAIPIMPDYLLPEAQAEWQRITPWLQKLKILSELDLAAIGMYCQTYAQWVEVQRKIKEFGVDSLVDVTPNQFKVQSVWFNMSTKLFEQMRSMLAEFGLSPLTRSRIGAEVCGNTDLFEDLDEIDDNQLEVLSKPNGPDRFFTKN